MSRNLLLYLDDIEGSCKKILRYVEGFDLIRFQQDDRTYDAVIRNLEIIGEAVNKLPPNFTEKYPEVEWRAIGALRNIVAHEYFGIKDEIIWDVVSNKIPLLLDQVVEIKRNEE